MYDTTASRNIQAQLESMTPTALSELLQYENVWFHAEINFMHFSFAHC